MKANQIRTCPHIMSSVGMHPCRAITNSNDWGQVQSDPDNFR